MAKVVLDLSGWKAKFQQLGGPGIESVARRMGVAGGRLLRDQAKSIASAAKTGGGRTKVPQRVIDSIYVAYDKRGSGSNVYTYNVTWNHLQARNGHWFEFGYYRRYVVQFNKKTGTFVTFKNKPLANPIRVPAVAFLARAYDSNLPEAKDAMIDAGKFAFEEFLK